MASRPDCETTLEVWFSRGKEDAWAHRSKQPPEQDPVAASFYDLGYSEGTIEYPSARVFSAQIHSPNEPTNLDKKVAPEVVGAS